MYWCWVGPAPGKGMAGYRLLVSQKTIALVPGVGIMTSRVGAGRLIARVPILRNCKVVSRSSCICTRTARLGRVGTASGCRVGGHSEIVCDSGNQQCTFGVLFEEGMRDCRTGGHCGISLDSRGPRITLCVLFGEGMRGYRGPSMKPTCFPSRGHKSALGPLARVRRGGVLFRALSGF